MIRNECKNTTHSIAKTSLRWGGEVFLFIPMHWRGCKLFEGDLQFCSQIVGWILMPQSVLNLL